MKINPGSSAVISVVKQDQKLEKKTEEKNTQQTLTDNISLENRRASDSQVENVEQAKSMLSSVIDEMQSHSSNDLYNSNIQRVVSLVQ